MKESDKYWAMMQGWFLRSATAKTLEAHNLVKKKYHHYRHLYEQAKAREQKAASASSD